MDGALPPCVAGGAVCVEGPAWLVTMGGGNWLMTFCMTMLGQLAKLWVIGCDVDMGPLAKFRPKKDPGLH